MSILSSPKNVTLNLDQKNKHLELEKETIQSDIKNFES